MKLVNILFEMQYSMSTYGMITNTWYSCDWYLEQNTAYHLPPIFRVVDALCGSSMS